MAKPSKAERLGTYVKKIGYFDIRQKIVKANPRRNTKGSGEVFLYHGKNKIGGPYKSHSIAEVEAVKLLDKGYKYKKHT